jgi:hypothetical protein
VLATEEEPEPDRSESLPDVVEAHLRADHSLDPAAAAMLARIFRAGYQQALRTPPPSMNQQTNPERPNPHEQGEPDEHDPSA